MGALYILCRGHTTAPSGDIGTLINTATFLDLLSKPLNCALAAAAGGGLEGPSGFSRDAPIRAMRPGRHVMP